MEEESGFKGKEYQISDSSVFRSLKTKTNPYFSENYELLLFQIIAIAERIGISIKVDKEKLRFLCYASFLGKVDGGEDTINYVNNSLSDSEKISEVDIAKVNLRKIFINPEALFTDEELTEIYNVVMHKSQTPEGKIVDAAHTLELVSRYMNRTGKWNGVDCMKYISSNANMLGKKYGETGTIELEPMTYNFANSIMKANNYSLYLLNGIIEKNKGNRQQLIEDISTFSYEKKKVM